MVEANQRESVPEAGKNTSGGVRSLRDLLDQATGRTINTSAVQESSGIAEQLPFPFLALVGQAEMKLALMLALINPNIGGVLLIGPRGTGKTTAVRSLVELLPDVPRSLCYYGCLPEDIEAGGMDAVCPECAQKYAHGEPLAKLDRVRLVELPLNAQLADVIGGVDERAVINERMRIKRGLLAQADRNLLYVDEVNLLEDQVIDALLDAAAQGNYTIRRGPIAATYWSRFVLIGSMNPEEGSLRPQIQDRFGMRVIVQGLKNPTERLEAYQRVQAYLINRRQVVMQFMDETEQARAEIQVARDLLPAVQLPENIARLGLELIEKLKINSLRAELNLFEAARAYAAADAREIVRESDLKIVAPMTLRLRRSAFFSSYIQKQNEEDAEINQLLADVLPVGKKGAQSL